MTLLANPDVSFPEVARLINTDAALAAQVLRLANSALFSFRAEIKTVLHAIVMVGLGAVRSIVYTASVWKLAGAKNNLARACWRHNLATALVAEGLGTADPATSTIYTAGLLHGIGQLAFAGRYPSEYAQLLAFSRQHNISMSECERAAFGVDHCGLGSRLLQEWRLPPELVDAARCHSGHLSPYRGTQLVQAACQTADRLGFRVGDADPAEHDASATEEQLAADAQLSEDLAIRINSVESSVGFC
jgi:HD-like signal output (HDOD) protein